MQTIQAHPITLAPPATSPVLALLPKRWRTTPRLLQLLAAGIVLTTLLLVGAIRHATVTTRAALQVLGSDSAPSIVAALRIRAALADLDANLVNQFLTAPGSKDRENSAQAAQRRREELGATLVRAAENVTFGEAERRPLVELVRGLSAFESSMSRALTLEEKGDHTGAMQVAESARTHLRNSLLPAADALEKANRDALENTTRTGAAKLANSEVELLGALVLAGAALGGAQFFLTVRTRRLVNPGLAIATIIVVLCVAPAWGSLSRAKELLRQAREDAFESVSLLWRARALANEANGLESRWLFEAGRSAAANREFQENLDRILRHPISVDWSRIPGILRAERLAPAGYEGLLIQALRNVTYEGEREALLQTVEALAKYCQIDARIRQLHTSGDPVAAIALCLSYAADGSNGAFDRFDAALEQALSLNQKEFEKRIESGRREIDGLEQTALLAAAGILAASAAGLWPRWREYLG